MAPPIALARRATFAAAALLVLVAGCDKPKPRAASSQPVTAATSTEPRKTPTTADPLPAQPAWAQELMGKPLKASFPKEPGVCTGNTDLVNMRYQGPSPGVRIEGWGWDAAAKAPIARVIVVDGAGLIIGAGEPGVARPDVTAARKDITSPTTGWQAVTAATGGGVDVFGVLADGGACRLGHINL